MNTGLPAIFSYHQNSSRDTYIINTEDIFQENDSIDVGPTSVQFEVVKLVVTKVADTSGTENLVRKHTEQCYSYTIDPSHIYGDFIYARCIKNIGCRGI